MAVESVLRKVRTHGSGSPNDPPRGSGWFRIRGGNGVEIRRLI